MHRGFSFLAACGLLAVAFNCNAAAQDWPAKPVKIMVGASPGGGTDIIARRLADTYQTSLKRPFIVENKPGASNTIAAEATAKAPADGYTIRSRRRPALRSHRTLSSSVTIRRRRSCRSRWWRRCPTCW